MSDNHDFAANIDNPSRPPRPHLQPLTSPETGSIGHVSDNASTSPVPPSHQAARVEDLNEEQENAAHTERLAQQPPTTEPLSPLTHQSRFNNPVLRHRSQTIQFNERSPPLTSPISPQGSGRLRHAGTDIFPTLSQQGRQGSALSASGASVYGRPRRTDTVKTYHQPTEVNWEPGAEPGIDTADEADDGRLHHVHELCDVTVIDYSDDQIQEYHLDNDPNNNTFKEFMLLEKPDWVSCRWIAINGLSWDIIKILGQRKGLHRLAIEDLLNTRSRTKADWYADHAFMVLTLQKLVLLHQGGLPTERDEDGDGIDDDEEEFKYQDAVKHKPLWRRIIPFCSSDTAPPPPAYDRQNTFSNYKTTGPDLIAAHSSTSSTDPIKAIRTLQRYHSANHDRIAFKEAHSALLHADLAVSVEQVSLFLTSDNDVISIFEHSAPDILTPLTTRLRNDETILRRSSDASMLIQSIIDAIIDLAMPVAAAYDDAIGSLEFDVLTDPDMAQPKKLYILASEITLLKNTIQPIASLVNALREHRANTTTLPSTPGLSGRPPQYRKQVSASTVEFTPLAHTYLSDVEDHVSTLNSNLDQLILSSEQLTNLIFNTLGSYQNESMKQLTLVTIFFLPLTFLTGYFGQNFHYQWSVQQNSDSLFWYIAVPVEIVIVLYLMRGMIGRVGRRFELRLWVRRRKRARRAVDGRGRLGGGLMGGRNGAGRGGGRSSGAGLGGDMDGYSGYPGERARSSIKRAWVTPGKQSGFGDDPDGYVADEKGRKNLNGHV